MPRYFIEVAYSGTLYSGFQTQENAITIQQKVEEALHILTKIPFALTGSSRTDAGVHAKQNFFHVDTDYLLSSKHIYSLNAILPADIAIVAISKVKPEAHARFDAISREYQYFIHTAKSPFLLHQSWLYPFPVSVNKLNEAAAFLQSLSNFETFSKRNTQVKTFECKLFTSQWFYNEHNQLVYKVVGNRFLRGMVRALVGTMLQYGRGKINFEQFKAIAHSKDCTKADFSTPPHGLFLVAVNYPQQLFVNS
ncbi:MAG: tRNA pseudouridine(38-40) synthase TruA [Chitinophagaceae bacterium]